MQQKDNGAPLIVSHKRYLLFLSKAHIKSASKCSEFAAYMFLNLKNFCLRSYVYDNQAKAFFWNIYRYSHSFITDILNNSIHDKI